LVWTHQRRNEVAVVVAHHADLLRLFEHVVDFLGGAVEDDVRLGRVLDLLQQRPVPIIAQLKAAKWEVEFARSPVVGALAQLAHGDRELGGAVRFQQLLQPHQPLVRLVDDGERLPAPRLHQVDVRLRECNQCIIRKPVYR